MKLYRATAFILFMLLPVASFGAQMTCRDVLKSQYFEPYRGVPLNGDTNQMFLGTGARASTVRLLINGQSVNLKRYKRSQVIYAKYDVRNLGYLSTVPGEDLNVRAAYALQGEDPRDVYIEDVEGQSLSSIILDTTGKYSLELKTRLFQRYYTFLKRAAQTFQPLDNVEISEFDIEGLSIIWTPVPALSVRSDEILLGLMLKPDNFFVNSRTLEMIIVDPN